MSPSILVTAIIVIHATCGLGALTLGCVLFFRPKRTAVHRRFGRLYAVSLLSVDVTGWLMHFSRNSDINAFHILALANLLALSGGIAAVICRRPVGKWYRYHYYLISWSYVGLVAAVLVEFMVKTAHIATFSPIATVTIITVLSGGLWIERKSRQLGNLPTRVAARQPDLQREPRHRSWPLPRRVV